jgi:hypothetical protein
VLPPPTLPGAKWSGGREGSGVWAGRGGRTRPCAPPACCMHRRRARRARQRAAAAPGRRAAAGARRAAAIGGRRPMDAHGRRPVAARRRVPRRGGAPAAEGGRKHLPRPRWPAPRPSRPLPRPDALLRHKRTIRTRGGPKRPRPGALAGADRACGTAAPRFAHLIAGHDLRCPTERPSAEEGAQISGGAGCQRGGWLAPSAGCQAAAVPAGMEGVMAAARRGAG